MRNVRRKLKFTKLELNRPPKLIVNNDELEQKNKDSSNKTMYNSDFK